MKKIPFAYLFALLAVLAPLLYSTLWPGKKTATPPPPPPMIRGKNDKTVLFFALAESGQINAQLAATQGLLERYPDFDIHFASFSKIQDKVTRVSEQIKFHDIPGPDRGDGIFRAMNCSSPVECLPHRPGAPGSALLAHQIELALFPWTGEEHFAIYERSIDIIRNVDPAVVVIDFAFRPPIDAVQYLNWNHMVITPLALADLFAMQQPYGAGLWKYPA
jgi:hypothetical protein